MNRLRFDKVPAWKQAIALLCGLYFLLTIFLPILIAIFVTQLPYIHNASFQSRFLVSTICIFTILSVLYSLNPKQFKSAIKKDIRSLALPIIGIILFSYSSAQFSPNLFGSLTRIFPSIEFEQQLKIEEASFYKHRTVSLTLIDEKTKQKFYLVLSSKLFDYPRFKIGDYIVIKSERNFLGSYVTSFELLDNQRSRFSRNETV